MFFSDSSSSDVGAEYVSVTPPPPASYRHVLRNPAFQLGAEMADQALDRPRGCIAQRADGVTFDLLGDLLEHVDLVDLRRLPSATAPSPATSSRCPRGTACTGRSSRACRTIDRRRDGAHDVGRLVHDDDRRRAQSRSDRLAARRSPSARPCICSAGTSGTEEPPGITASRLPQPPRMPPQWLLDQLAERNAHGSSSTTQGLSTWPLKSGTAWCPCCPLARSCENHAAPRRRIVGATAIDSTLLTVVGHAVEPRPGRERRLETRLPLLAFEAFEHRGLFAADVGAGAAMDEDVEIIAGAARVLADQGPAS